MIKQSVILLLSFCTFQCNLYSQSFDPKEYVVYKSTSNIDIDGLGNEGVWEKTPWTDDFIDITGDEDKAPRYRTRAKILWDNDNLYFYAELEEPNLWATFVERESIVFKNHNFEVFLDPDNDTHNYYEYEINVFGTEWDLMLVKPYRDGGPSDSGWDIKGIKSAVQSYGTINKPDDKDDKWTVEIAMPWESLIMHMENPAAPKDGDQWRLNFNRVEWKIEGDQDGIYHKIINPETKKRYNEDNWVWSSQGAVSMHLPEMFGFIQFSDKSPGSNVDFNRKESRDIIWELRKIYFAQRDLKKSRGEYSKKKSDFPQIDKYKFKIQLNKSDYKASIKGSNGSTWNIRADGLIWEGDE